MTDHTQLRKLATEALHWVPICDEPDCSCREAWKNYADAANPQAVIELLDEIERLKKDAERYRWLRGPDFESTRYSRWKIEYWAGQNGWAPMQREQMDVAIDAAISKMESTAVK